MSDHQPESQITINAQVAAPASGPGSLAPLDPLQRWCGVLPAFRSLDEINLWIREMRDDQDNSEPAS